MNTPIFTFIHAADTHLSESYDVITPFVESVNSAQFHARPDFIVFGGDNIDGCWTDGSVCEREMPMLKDRLERLHVPYHIICHNHDTWGEACRGDQYRRYFGNRLNYTQELPHGFAAIFMSGCYVGEGGLLYDIVDNVSWLDHALGELKDRSVLLFHHLPLFPPRKPVPTSRISMLRREDWQASGFSLETKVSNPVRGVIAKHGNVIVHYSGHCHVHSVTESEGTSYVTTASLATQPWEYRYVEVYPHRIKHRCILPHELRGGLEFWTNCSDDDHPDVDLYHDGLPDERDFVIRD